MYLTLPGLTGERDGGILPAVGTTTLGAATLPFTGIHQPISIVGFTAIALGIVLLLAHVSLYMFSHIIVR